MVHARTKADGYRPPADWARVHDIRQAVTIPVVANGEIWTVDDARRCRAASGCDTLMLGRGMVTDPGLALAIRVDSDAHHLPWEDLQPLVNAFWQLVCSQLEPRSRAGRLKQWLNFLRRQYPEAETAFLALRAETDQAKVTAWLAKNKC